MGLFRWLRNLFIKGEMDKEEMNIERDILEEKKEHLSEFSPDSSHN